MSPLIVWTRTGCPACEKAKDYLRSAGIPFWVHQEDDLEARKRLYRAWGFPEGEGSMPQIFVPCGPDPYDPAGSTIRLGGYDDMVREKLAEHWPALCR